ncbi:MAG: hypothetical protein ABI652_04085 [Acidobacteriota bacterium]
MATVPGLSLKKNKLPFLLSGASEVSIDTADLHLGAPIPEVGTPVLDVTFSASGAEHVVLGQGQSVKVSLSATAHVALTPVFSTSKSAAAKRLTPYGLGEFFKGGKNKDKVVLAFEAGTATDAALAGSFSYAPLKAGAVLNAGGDASYAYLRAMDKTQPIELLLVDYFQTIRLPDLVDAGTMRPPAAGEAIALQFGGEIRLGTEVAAGYELSGSKAFSLGGLALSEQYDLSVVGRIGLKAGVAGRFSILVTAADGLPDWARVQVRRHRATDMAIAADVNVGFRNQLELPATADEFLGAVLGVNAKNFLTVLHKARDLADFDAFKAATDGLARRYVGEFVARGFDALETRTEFAKFLGRVNTVVASYEQVADRSVALFDRYFDRLDTLTGFLDRLTTIEDAGLDTLRKELTPELWKMLAQLTDGDPLGFLLRQVTVGGVQLDTAAELKKRAEAALDLIRSEAHTEIRDAIGLAKNSFGLDALFRKLATIDTVDELQAVANDKAGEFVSRLVGRSLDSATNIKLALVEVRAVLDKIDGFKDRLFATFKEAAKSSYKMALHAQYSRASERDALVDVLIRPGHPHGADLLRQAGRGDFEEILTTADTDLVRLREGLFSHRTRRERAFSVNIIGWHLNYRYSGFDRVITQVEQRRMVPSADGIAVFTTADVEVDRVRKRQDEQIHVNFLLRALAESAAAVTANAKNTAFLIDTLKSLTATYKLEFTDDDTSLAELNDYLAFARDLGLDAQGATIDMLDPLLPRAPNGGFGRVAASFDVRFGPNALAALLSVRQISPVAERAIRTAMRGIVLANFLKSDEMHDVAFAYATPAVFAVFREEGFAAFTNMSERVFQVALGDTQIAAPAAVELNKMERQLLVTLYNIEEQMVGAIKALYRLLAGKRIAPDEFEKRLGGFADALTSFDKFDQTTNRRGIGANSIFVVFQALVRLAAKGDAANVAVLRLESDVGGKSVEKLFMSDEAAVI